MYYYNIAVVAEGGWAQELLTYQSTQVIKPHSVVLVPFGTKKKQGLVVNKATKPTFKAKDILEVTDIILPKQTFELLRWYTRFYGTTMQAGLHQFLPSYVSSIDTSKEVERYLKLEHTQIARPLEPLTKGQQKALKAIEQEKQAYMLHGVTGSGKTRIFLELAQKTLHAGQSVVVIYPEISLSAQTIEQLSRIGTVIAYHSKMTTRERKDAWRAVYRSETPYIVAGTRSALFLPHTNVGLVVVDEAHEASLNQDSDIRYNGVHVAAALAKVQAARFVALSATPPVTDTAHILEKGALVCLHEKAHTTAASTNTTIVDIKDRQQFMRHHMLSDVLLDEIRRSLEQGKQSLLFINRRGTAKTVTCASLSCGWQPICPRCDLPLTYHHDRYLLLCHTCGFHEPMLGACPTCGSSVTLRTLGNKAVVEELSVLFPRAKIARFDSDNTKAASFDALFHSVKSGAIDILIGTQQIIKGLDLPQLRLVGLLQADLSLAFPDYTSDERTFQLITQALGRVGRGHTAESRVIIQTLQPKNPLLAQAISEDWHSFYEQELSTRKQHALPPFTHIATVLFRGKQEKRVIAHADLYRSKLEEQNDIQIEGPIPSFIRKRDGYFQYQVILKSSQRSAMLAAARSAPKDTVLYLDAQSLL